MTDHAKTKLTMALQHAPLAIEELRDVEENGSRLSQLTAGQIAMTLRRLVVAVMDGGVERDALLAGHAAEVAEVTLGAERQAKRAAIAEAEATRLRAEVEQLRQETGELRRKAGSFKAAAIELNMTAGRVGSLWERSTRRCWRYRRERDEARAEAERQRIRYGSFLDWAIGFVVAAVEADEEVGRPWLERMEYRLREERAALTGAAAEPEETADAA